VRFLAIAISPEVSVIVCPPRDASMQTTSPAAAAAIVSRREPAPESAVVVAVVVQVAAAGAEAKTRAKVGHRSTREESRADERIEDLRGNPV
jgi:hypothetical protein